MENTSLFVSSNPPFVQNGGHIPTIANFSLWNEKQIQVSGKEGEFTAKNNDKYMIPHKLKAGQKKIYGVPRCGICKINECLKYTRGDKIDTWTDACLKCKPIRECTGKYCGGKGECIWFNGDFNPLCKNCYERENQTFKIYSSQKKFSVPRCGICKVNECLKYTRGDKIDTWTDACLKCKPIRECTGKYCGGKGECAWFNGNFNPLCRDCHEREKEIYVMCTICEKSTVRRKINDKDYEDCPESHKINITVWCEICQENTLREPIDASGKYSTCSKHHMVIINGQICFGTYCSSGFVVTHLLSRFSK
jgi:hypothetical protein